MTEPDAAPPSLVARPFEGFDAPSRVDPVEVLRVLFAYGGGAVCGFALLIATMTHRPAEGAAASARLGRARALEQARAESARALQAVERTRALEQARVGSAGAPNPEEGCDGR